MSTKTSFSSIKLKYTNKSLDNQLHKVFQVSIFINRAMPNLITVNNIVGESPYQIYLCLSGNTPCYYIDTITSAEVPYSFYTPTPIEDYSYYCIRIIDNVDCVITDCFNIT
jgi:hypothetical protein